jgi:pimeloyl-ACP methyl ester carboxylesterase
LYLGKSADKKLLDDFPEPLRLPAWLTKADLDYYVSAFKKTGIAPALNFYRNVTDDYPRLKEIYKTPINQPVLFIGGGEEAAVRFGSVDPMKESLSNLQNIIILPDCGHWLQQERPDEVNNALIEFLNDVTQSKG